MMPADLVDADAWRVMAAGPAAFLALWADGQRVLALYREAAGTPRLVSCPVVDGGYPALSLYRPEAARFEARIAHRADGAAAPLPPPEGPSVWLGPSRAGIQEPVVLHAVLRGERVAHLTVGLGFAHKGTLGHMLQKTPRAAAKFAARIAGDSTVAHSLAFARAAEAATGTDAPPRAAALRGLACDMERLGFHAGTVGLREDVRSVMAVAFGHRLGMDWVIPGGVAADLPEGAHPALLALLGRADPRFETERAAALPSGPIAVPLPIASGEGLGMAEGPRGMVCHWLRLEGGQIGAAFAYDPSWAGFFQLEEASPGADVAQLPILSARAGAASAVDL